MAKKSIKEILADFKQTLAVTMQSTRNVVDVTQHYIDLLADAEEGGGGSSSHDYTTDEQIIGTWFGKTLYEKSWDNLNASVTGSDWATLSDVTVANLGDIINASVFRVGTANNLINIGLKSFSADNSGTHLQIARIETGNQTIKYVTMQYTKS